MYFFLDGSAAPVLRDGKLVCFGVGRGSSTAGQRPGQIAKTTKQWQQRATPKYTGMASDDDLFATAATSRRRSHLRPVQKRFEHEEGRYSQSDASLGLHLGFATQPSIDRS
jgi:hypothetical protein